MAVERTRTFANFAIERTIRNPGSEDISSWGPILGLLSIFSNPLITQIVNVEPSVGFEDIISVKRIISDRKGTRTEGLRILKGEEINKAKIRQTPRLYRGQNGRIRFNPFPARYIWRP